MGGRIPDEVIDQIRTQVDIVDVVSTYVQLKKSGRNFFGLCPFHSERTPSFSVSPEKQIYHCFGCGVGGDVIRFVMDIEQLTFVEAVKHLAEQAGIPLPESVSVESQENEELREMRHALELTARLYHHLLLHEEYGRVARQYLESRQVRMETIKEFQLGYAPLSDHQLLFRFLKRRGFQPALLEKIGLITSRSSPSMDRFYDRFRGRIIFPIHDTQGRVIGFGGRSLGNQEPKYLNSPETPLFHKGSHLFNLHRARTHIRKKQQAVLFEGYMDVISAWQAGIYTGIATLGTSLTEQQAKVIKRNTDSVIICYDADTAGQAAAERGTDLLRKYNCTVKIAQMPGKMDPDDYIRCYGASAFQEEVLAGAMSLTAFKLEMLKKKYHLQDEDDRLKYLTVAIDLISELPLAIEQDHYLRRLADEFHLSLDALKEEQRRIKLRKKKEKKGDKQPAKWNNGKQEDAKHLVVQARSASLAETSEKHLLALMMKSQAIAAWVEKELGSQFQTETYEALAAHLYRYYQVGYSADVGRFIGYLEQIDPSLIPKVSELAMLDLPDPDQVSEAALKDYVSHIKNGMILSEIERKEKEQQRLIQAGESIQAAQLGQEIAMLKRKIQRGLIMD
ncbi:DNA primase [Thermoflavimicrobium dichotomicum]|uniref:DNA primase n=1 Tax=Thermoflavimicrobium dichotomicum TaxID=46223 RepID=A0A1I3NGJ3_9BACL|nr:DNA primase [Thermoflavimicrobium dichotomicum]SFJ08488.1 DNA primase [Thermoflavimicrobium dichotomicum]